jgi:peptide deformylase
MESSTKANPEFQFCNFGVVNGRPTFYLTDLKARFGVIYPVVTFGHEILRQKAVPVAEINDEVRQLVQDMLESMYAAKGVGLAAEQVGRTESVCVIDVPRDAEKEACRDENAAILMPLVLINPEIVSAEGKQRNEEGCLSFPEIGAPITRADKVTVTYTDRDGVSQTVTARGLLSRAIQHEVDHLSGVLLVDKMSPMQKMSVSGQLRRLQKIAREE